MSDQENGKSYRLRRPGGNIDTTKVFNAPAVVLWICGLTILAFVFLALAPNRAGQIIELSAGVSPRRFLAGPEANGGVLRMLSPLIGHMFVHAGIMHLGFNMLWLLAVGTPVARRMGAGSAREGLSSFACASMFLTFYFLCGAAGGLVYIMMHADQYTLLVGASGGVSGLLGALVRFAFNRTSLFGPEQSQISPLFSPAVLTWSAAIIGMNIILGVFGGGLAGGAQIAWEAHLGGYFFGLVAYPFFERAGRAFRQ